ncbi:MAG TPA: hypothetical protein VF244_07555 [Acidimicrobiales bacterium]
MRKFIITGLGALSTLTIAMGSTTTAFAADVVPATVSEQVCAAVPVGLLNVVDLLAENAIESALITTADTAANLDLSVKTTQLVGALVEHINAVDGGGNVGATSSIVSARVSAYSTSAAAWTAVKADRYASDMAAEVLGLQQGVLSSLGGSLECPIPEPEI